MPLPLITLVTPLLSQVDDTPINRAVLRRTLEAVGASVVEAHDGLAAYELYRSCGGSQTFSLVLMDLCMPVCDGWTATSYIRALERAAGWPAAPVIACTSECVDLGTLALQRCWEVGMDGVVVSPGRWVKLVVGPARF